MKEKSLIVLICSVMLTLSGCTREKATIIPVQVWFEGQQVACDLVFSQSPNVWRIQALSFYLSDLYTGENSNRIHFATESPELHLIRMDKQHCSAQIPVEHLNGMVAGDSLAFSLGVPFSDNHNNPVTQPWPLNVPDMFWTWRNGYKFLRIDMQSAADAWAYHLGSVGCVSSSAVRGPEKACAQPNRTQHSLTVPDAAHWGLVLHLDRLLGDMSPGMKNRCVMHGDREPACQELFAHLTNRNHPVFTLEPFVHGDLSHEN